MSHLPHSHIQAGLHVCKTERERGETERKKRDGEQIMGIRAKFLLTKKMGGGKGGRHRMRACNKGSCVDRTRSVFFRHPRDKYDLRMRRRFPWWKHNSHLFIYRPCMCVMHFAAHLAAALRPWNAVIVSTGRHVHKLHVSSSTFGSCQSKWPDRLRPSFSWEALGLVAYEVIAAVKECRSTAVRDAP